MTTLDFFPQSAASSIKKIYLSWYTLAMNTENVALPQSEKKYGSWLKWVCREMHLLHIVKGVVDTDVSDIWWSVAVQWRWNEGTITEAKILMNV